MGRMVGNNLPKVKKQNETSIKTVIYKYGPISRSEIASLLSLTPPTITNNVAALINEGWVEECLDDSKEQVEHALGRRPVKVDFIKSAGYVIGIEDGPYNTAMVLLDLRGNLIAQKVLMPMTSPSYETLIDEIAAAIEKIIDDSAVPKHKILGVGMGIPGFVQSEKGLLRYGARHRWVDKYVAKDLCAKVQLPVVVENNARARAIGEEMLSKKARPDTFAYYLIARGIACPLVIRNKLLAGGTAGAGEVGHMIVERNGPACPTCGHHGCLEGLASEQAIKSRCRQAIDAGLHTILTEICQDSSNPTIQEIVKAQECADRIVCSIMEDAVTYLGISVASIINFISPKTVIIDGFIMKSAKNQQLLLKVASENLFALNEKEVEIDFVEFDEFRGAKGAAALALKKFLLKA